MPTAWLRVTIERPSDELAPLLAEGLLACGGSAIEEQANAWITYMPADSDREAIRAQVNALVSADAKIAFEEVPEQDWLALWRAGLEPRRVGERIIVSPTWSDVDARDSDIVIRIDPQMAFGTGEHASTRGVLRLMQKVVRHGQHVLDVGSGSAILAIAAVALGATHVVAAESDEDAMENAQENVARNGVADRVTLLNALVDGAFLGAYGGGAFDGVVANVLSGVLRPLLPAFHTALAAGGWAILSGILIEEADTMRAAAHDSAFTIEAEDVEEQWWSVLLRRT
jgi:ribosomal protein L11 methyltransferase